MVYLPPALKAEQVRRCLRDVNDAVVHIKQKYVDPYLMLGGDFNKKDIRLALQDHSDIKPLPTGPTRGDSVLDILATNFNEHVRGYGTTDPIVSEADIPTDHLTVYASFTMSKVPEYKIEEYTYFHETPEGNSKFGTWLTKQDWAELLAAEDVDRKVEILHDLFNEATAYSYEWKVRKKKSSEPV